MVEVTRDNGSDELETGDSINADEGHLYVFRTRRDGTRAVLAIFAPGAWTHAEVKESQ